MSIQQKTVWGDKVARGFSRATLLLVVALLPGKAVWAQPHARLSPSLQKYLSNTSIDVVIQHVEEIERLPRIP